MSKDVKIEVLYYKTPADVSLEFGLHGDYPLRLLSSSCDDIGTFFKGLKRAVSRSEIIITVGGYGEDNLPGFIARAVGKKCVIPNYRKNGIITETKYILPEDAIPLASKDKRFGGFLIECGPQTIISLTDDKKIRLEIVKKFVVQYITEHHNVFNTPFSAHNLNLKSETAAAVENNEGVQDISEDAPSHSEVAESAEAEPLESVTAVLPTDDSECVINEPENQVSEDISEIQTETDAKIPVETNSADTDISKNSDNSYETDTNTPFLSEKSIQLSISPDDISFESKDDSRCKARHTRRIVRIVCLVLSLLIIVGMTAVLCVFDGDKRKVNTETDYYTELQITYSAMSDDLSAAFDRIKAQNSDFVTWLTVEETNIHHPVLTVPNVTDSERYLQYLPDGTYSKAGTLFSSDSISPNLTPGSTVIYGSAAEGGIFEQLRTVSDGSQTVANVITADSRYQATWTFLSAFTKSEAQDFDFTRTVFSGNDDYISHLEKLNSFSGDTAERQFKGYEKLILLVGIDGQEQYCVAALLTSVRVLSVAPPVNNNTSEKYESGTNSADTSSEVSTEPEEAEESEDTDYDNAPDASEIVLPSLPSSPSSSNSSPISSNISSVPSTSSAVTSSGNTSSTPSGSTSSADTSTNPSVPSGTSSLPSSSSAISSAASSAQSSSAASSSTAPAIDPMYTWDITLYVIDSATGTKYSANAVDIIAMIIEDEMSPTIDPPEALIAQSIAAYNWLLNNGATKESTAPKVALDPAPEPQAFECAAAAKGSILLYGNTVAKTNYYAYSAGKTACTQDIWGGTAYPYLQSVDCSVDEELEDFITKTTYSAEKIQSLILEKCRIDVSNIPKSEWLKPVQYDANGLYCIKISIGGTEYKGSYLRSTILTKANTGISTIRSTAYTISYNDQTDEFTVTCKGYGHGVGMSQRGAKAYAKQGWTHEQILAHFFPGTTLVKN